MIEYALPIAMYAETHFRFFGLSPSALFRREPEIVFDLPRRLTAKRDLPVALLINDIDRFPICIENVQVTVSVSGNRKETRLFDFDRGRVDESIIAHPLPHKMSAYILTVPRSELPCGGEQNNEIFVNACLRYRRVNKKGTAEKNIRTALNDNLPTSSKLSFRCIVSEGEYPGAALCSYGDIHCHSMFSRSHVEWGPPVSTIGVMTAASGLDFAAVTDHSYDLACDPENYLQQDKDLRLWQMYKSSIKNYGDAHAILIPSEEVSVINSKRTAVHLGALGISEYIPGTLDGARKNRYFKKQLTIAEATSEIERQGGVSFAAHPGAKVGFFQATFLNRGEWENSDIREGLSGLQAVNDGSEDSWARSKKLWISSLQKGRKLPILAGSDAHGDFNRYRAIGIPFLQISEEKDRYMGFVRTGIYEKRKDAKDIISGIRNGQTFITNGPFAMIYDNDNPEVSLIGSKPLVNTRNLQVKASSTKEFGSIKNIKVIMGCPNVKDEKVITQKSITDDTYDISIPIPTNELSDKCYLRVDVEGISNTTAATSACFIGY